MIGQDRAGQVSTINIDLIETKIRILLLQKKKKNSEKCDKTEIKKIPHFLPGAEKGRKK